MPVRGRFESRQPRDGGVRARVLAVALVLAGGCLQAVGAGLVVVPFLDLQAAEPGGRTEFALVLRADRDTAVDVEAVDFAQGWRVELERTRVDVPAEGTTLVVAVEPGEDAAYGLHYVRLKVGPREVFLAVEVQDAGEVPLRPGLGALVRTVGFFANGSVFYTNMKEVRDNALLRHAQIDPDAPPPTDADYEPLKVYVGGRRGEAPPEPYNASGYSPVIDGFDARLRGMREGDTLVARLTPEEAYTRAGNEDHVLYGDALNFVVQVVRVDDLGAPPTCGLPVCPPARR